MNRKSVAICDFITRHTDETLQRFFATENTIIDPKAFVATLRDTCTDAVTETVLNQSYGDFLNQTTQLTSSNAEPPLYPTTYTTAYKSVHVTAILLISTIAILGNTLLLIVIVKCNSLHNATNVYLASLAVSDMIMVASASLPSLYHIFFAIDEWRFGRTPCKLAIYAQYVGVNTSSLTICLFSFVRYLVICHPLKFQNFKRFKASLVNTTVLWLLVMLYSIVWLAWTDIYEIGQTGRFTCKLSRKRTFYARIFFTDLIGMYVAPLGLTTFFYVKIWLAIKRSQYDVTSRYACQTSNQNLTSNQYQNSDLSSSPKINRACLEAVAGSSALQIDRLDVPLLSRRESSGGESNSYKTLNEPEEETKSRRNRVSVPNTRLAELGIPTKRLSAPQVKKERNSKKRRRLRRLVFKSKDTNPMIMIETPTREESPPIQMTKIVPLLKHQGELSNEEKFERLLDLVNEKTPIRRCSQRGQHRGNLFRSATRVDSGKAAGVEIKCESLDMDLCSNTQGGAQIRSSSSMSKSRKNWINTRTQILRMLIAVTLSFAILMFPYRAIVAYNSFTSPEHRVNNLWAIFVCRLLIYISSCINPIIYNVYSTKFREAFVSVVPMPTGLKRRLVGNRNQLIPITALASKRTSAVRKRSI